MLRCPIGVLPEAASSARCESPTKKPFTGGERDMSRVKMPHNNRVSASAALRTNDMWSRTIGHNPYASAEEESERKDENAHSASLLLLANRMANLSGVESRGGCDRCGMLGHYRSQCRNPIATKTNTTELSSDSDSDSDSSTDVKKPKPEKRDSLQGREKGKLSEIERSRPKDRSDSRDRDARRKRDRSESVDSSDSSSASDSDSSESSRKKKKTSKKRKDKKHKKDKKRSKKSKKDHKRRH